jgi:hypothetical protein
VLALERAPRLVEARARLAPGRADAEEGAQRGLEVALRQRARRGARAAAARAAARLLERREELLQVSLEARLGHVDGLGRLAGEHLEEELAVGVPGELPEAEEEVVGELLCGGGGWGGMGWVGGRVGGRGFWFRDGPG